MEKSRVRLSSIDLLPEEAEADIIWAIAEIEAGNRLAIDIHAEFNARLADRGIGPISKSAFSRYALRKRKAFARLREVREISTAISRALGPSDDDDLMTAIAQMMKSRVYELLEEKAAVDTKGVKELGQGVQALVSAQRMSAENRRRLEASVNNKVSDAVDTVAKANGMSEQTAESIKAQLLGVVDK